MLAPSCSLAAKIDQLVQLGGLTPRKFSGKLGGERGWADHSIGSDVNRSSQVNRGKRGMFAEADRPRFTLGARQRLARRRSARWIESVPVETKGRGGVGDESPYRLRTTHTATRCSILALCDLLSPHGLFFAAHHIRFGCPGATRDLECRAVGA